MAQEMCSIHPDREVVDVCVHCGKRVCTACAASLAGKTYCLECIKVVDPNISNQAGQVVWERRGEVGFLSALYATWLNLLLHPKKFFQDMPIKAGIGGPLLFALICGCTAVIAAALINTVAVLSGVTPPNMAAGAASKPAMILSYVMLMALSPILVSAGIFVLAGIYHVTALMFGGREGFNATFRVLSYTNALALFNIIPLAGPIFVTVYSLILFAIGFKHVQKMSTTRAVVTALLPMLVLFVIGFAVAFYLAAQGGAIPPLQAPAAVPPPPVTP